jgi:hypothetical protein
MLRYASHVACLHVLSACAGAQNPVSALNSNASSLPPLHLQSLRDNKDIKIVYIIYFKFITIKGNKFDIALSKGYKKPFNLAQLLLRKLQLKLVSPRLNSYLKALILAYTK